MPWTSRAVLCLLTLLCTAASCRPVVKSSLNRPLSASELAELWAPHDDVTALDLFYGVGGAGFAPPPDADYLFLEEDTTGYSGGYDVAGPHGLEWSVKTGEEAQPEVVASRLLWAAGFRQPPAYYLPRWTLAGGPSPGVKGPARFRPKLAWLDKTGEWAWHDNPFVGSQPFRGLIVLNLMLNNADLRTPNNAIYELPLERRGARRWFMVRDVGGSLGSTGFVYGTRNNIDEFERQGFVKSADGNRVEFDYHGRHRELLQILSPADVRWAAERWAALTPGQWQDAFRAGGYAPEIADRYIRKLREKIDQGLGLAGSSVVR